MFSLETLLSEIHFSCSRRRGPRTVGPKTKSAGLKPTLTQFPSLRTTGKVSLHPIHNDSLQNLLILLIFLMCTDFQGDKRWKFDAWHLADLTWAKILDMKDELWLFRGLASLRRKLALFRVFDLYSEISNEKALCRNVTGQPQPPRHVLSWKEDDEDLQTKICHKKALLWSFTGQPQKPRHVFPRKKEEENNHGNSKNYWVKRLLALWPMAYLRSE